MQSIEIIIIIIYSLCLAFIFCYSLVQLQLSWLYLRFKKNENISASAPPNLQTWPAVTVQLPVYNEMYVIERLLDAIIALDYPADKLQIQVLDDSTDATTEIIDKKIAEYRADGKNIVHIRRPDRVGYKAGALQHGLASATGEFIAVFDADFLPSPDFLKKTVPHFNQPDVGVVQTRWGHLNQNYSWLTKLQAFGLNAHFTIEQTGRAAGGYFINFNGTAGIWRKSCIIDAGGWQADTLTEDLDLSYRAQLKNWKFKYLEQVEAPAELPAAMGALKSQQFRWTKGAAETARKHLGKVLSSDKSGGVKINALFHLLNSSVFVCILLTALLSIPILAFKIDAAFLNIIYNTRALFIISLAALISFYWIAYRQQHSPKALSVFTFIPQFFLFLTISMGLSLHNAIAVAEGYLGVRTPFIRTPKFNIISGKDTWRNSLYTVKNITLLSFLEGLLCLYFTFGIYLGFKLHNYGMLPFHTMLSLGFGIVFYYSIQHSR